MTSMDARAGETAADELEDAVARKLAEIEGQDWAAGMTAPVAENRTTYGVDAPL